jgi:DNA-binding NtrC family response regulator
LQNYIERAVVMADTDELTLDLLPVCVVSRELPEGASLPHGDFDSLTREVVMRGLAESSAVPGAIYSVIVEQIEKELISQVLASCGGVQTKAATKLGINRNTLHKKIKDYKLDEFDKEE